MRQEGGSSIEDWLLSLSITYVTKSSIELSFRLEPKPTVDREAK